MAVSLIAAVVLTAGTALAADGSEATSDWRCPDDIWECLPAWRWSLGWGSLVAANPGLDPISMIDNTSMTVFNIITLMAFTVAEMVWYVALAVLKWVTDPTFITGLYDAVQTSMAENWGRLFDALGVPGRRSGSMLWVFPVVLALCGALWMFAFLTRYNPWISANLTQHGRWYSIVAKLMRTIVPLAMLILLAANYDREGSPFTPKKLMERTTGTLQSAVMPVLESVAETLKSEDGANKPYSTCELYEERLIDAFDAGGPAEGEGWEKHRTSLPKMVSQVWESSYLKVLGMAQFGDSRTAERAMCFTMEWSRSPVSPGAQLMMIYEALGVRERGYHLQPGVEELKNAGANPYLREGDDDDRHDRNVIDGIGTKMLRPSIGDPVETSSLLTLAAACGFKEPKSASPQPYRASADRDRYGPQDSWDFHGDHEKPTSWEKVGPRPRPTVWLHKEWTGLQKDWQHDSNYENTLSSNVCAAWLFPSIVHWHFHTVLGQAFDRVASGAASVITLGFYDDISLYKDYVDQEFGLRSGWVQDHAAFTAGDVESWRRRSLRNMADGVAGTPTVKEVQLVNRVLEAARGENSTSRLVYGFWAVVIALVYMKTLGGLSLGLLVAQLILGMLFFVLPLLLFVAALPIPAAAHFHKRMIRLYLATTLSYALFYTLLMLTILLTDIINSWLEAMTGAEGFILAFIVGASPLLALWLVHKALKMFGMGKALSFQGAAQLSSGLSAAGLRLPDTKKYAGTAAKVGLKGGRLAGQAAGKLGVSGVKAARNVKRRKDIYTKRKGLSPTAALSRAFTDQARASWDDTRKNVNQSVSRSFDDFRDWGKDRLDHHSKIHTKTPWQAHGDRTREETKLKEELTGLENESRAHNANLDSAVDAAKARNRRNRRPSDIVGVGADGVPFWWRTPPSWWNNQQPQTTTTQNGSGRNGSGRSRGSADSNSGGTGSRIPDPRKTRNGADSNGRNGRGGRRAGDPVEGVNEYLDNESTGRTGGRGSGRKPARKPGPGTNRRNRGPAPAGATPQTTAWLQSIERAVERGAMRGASQAPRGQSTDPELLAGVARYITSSQNTNARRLDVERRQRQLRARQRPTPVRTGGGSGGGSGKPDRSEHAWNNDMPPDTFWNDPDDYDSDPLF